MHLKKYKDIVLFLWKYGNRNVIKESGLMNGLEVDEPKTDTMSAPDEQALVRDIQNLGPTFIKLGQLLSTRPDLISEPYLKALRHLQDNLEPFPYREVEQIVESELGVRMSKAFNSFEANPLAAASLGQVHRAELRSGEVVAVKVQRQGIRRRVLEELEVLEEVTTFMEKNTALGKKYNLSKLYFHFKGTLLRELNYLKEAQHMQQLHENLKDFQRIVVPTAIADYTTDKVLTMQFIKGRNISRVSPLKITELDGDRICEDLFKAYLQQIVIDGFLHADPHPGNVYLTEDNRVALLDMGMVAHLSGDLRQHYLQLILNISENKANEAIDVLLKMSSRAEDADEELFRRTISQLIQENQDASVDEIDTGSVVFGLIHAAAESGFHLPMELSTVGKALLNLDLVAHKLAPEFNPNKTLRKHAMSLMNKLMYKELAPQNFLSTLLEGKELLEKMPERLNKIIGNVADNNVRIAVDAFDERHMMKGFQKVANRITIGLILAALVVGSALMMSVPTNFTLFGYPGLAIIAFLAAVVGAIGLAVNIFFYDES